MHQPTTLTSHQSLMAAALPGSWKLDAGRALTLRPLRGGVLRITQGRVWLTLDGVQDNAQAAGDVFLVPGRALMVQAGQRLVLESAGVKRDAAAHFSWDPLPQAQARALHGALGAGGRWQQAVAQPLRDLGLALGQAGAALGRLALGVAGLATGPVAAGTQQRSC